MIIALLMLPVYILRAVYVTRSTKDNTIATTVLLLFTAWFAAALTLFTRAKCHEILGATAA